MFDEKKAAEVLRSIRKPLMMKVGRRPWERVGTVRRENGQVEVLDWDLWGDPWDRSPLEDAVTLFGVHAPGGGVVVFASSKKRVLRPSRGRRVPYGPSGLRSSWREPR